MNLKNVAVDNSCLSFGLSFDLNSLYLDSNTQYKFVTPKMMSLIQCLFQIFVLGQFATWACMPSDASNSVSANGETYVCIVLSPLTWGYTAGSSSLKGKYLRIATKLKADEFSRINVAASWNSTSYSQDAVTKALSIAEVAGNGVGVSVSSMGVTSYQKSYRMYGDTPKTFPMLMVLITVDAGKVIVSPTPYYPPHITLITYFFLIYITLLLQCSSERHVGRQL